MRATAVVPLPTKEAEMQEELDLTQGWCCDGRTWHEHAEDDGHCCQSRGTKIVELPRDGQEKARDRLATQADLAPESGEEAAEPDVLGKSSR